MKIHEYQAKEILKNYGVPVPRGGVAETPEEAREIAEEIGEKAIVVKAQIHAGGRGKGGGVKVVSHPEEVEKAAKEIIGMTLVTHQTGPEGRVVRRVLIEEGVEIQEELYLGVVIDRSKACPVIMASREGGVEIEKVAAESPEKIVKEWVGPTAGLRAFQANKIGFGLGFKFAQVGKMRNIILNLYKAFYEKDCLLAEINPLVLTTGGELIALDAKMNFDDNGLFRHKEIAALRDIHEEAPLEVEASKYNLNYIKLDGDVGCMVNGAGLAMATMDIIKVVGAEPANFLDVGGGATAEMVRNAFKILMSDPKVKVVFINIFGGILRCDTLAKGVTEAVREVKVNVPIVVRLEGTNVEEGRRILNESGLNFAVAIGMKEGAQKVVEALKRSQGQRA
ncbi:MAG TPA: ADP-forming succinate--CoA ligase subunit beta [Thermodesulfobacteriota bacterium]|nr:ADP-forming succinate--CoA ligase subunit beta [Thermodesulfobacteriota bacterium]